MKRLFSYMGVKGTIIGFVVLIVVINAVVVSGNAKNAGNSEVMNESIHGNLSSSYESSSEPETLTESVVMNTVEVLPVTNNQELYISVLKVLEGSIYLLESENEFAVFLSGNIQDNEIEALEQLMVEK